MNNVQSAAKHLLKVQRLRTVAVTVCGRASYWDDDIVYTFREILKKFIRELREVTNLVNI